MFSVNNKKFQKFYPKTEADWNFKGEGKKSDVFIKDPKDFRLLRLISEGLLNPQDTLPVVSNDAITSSQINSKYFSFFFFYIRELSDKEMIRHVS